jgi:nitroimidazol reductase NimA-like FMN-containing flavoprotein (pyridoxamine 5'-phosphate oxidase superfamily)
MSRIDARTGVEVIDRAECLDLLRQEVIGRIAIVEGTGPLVLPVNYAMHGDRVVFRTGPGSKLAASRGGAACFEIDGFDRATRSGWSVVVRGRLEEVTVLDRQHDEVADLADPWLGPDGRPNVLRLVPAVISGRRARPAPTPPT